MNYVKNIWAYFQKLGRSWQIGSNSKEILKVYYTFSHYKTFFSFLHFYIFLHKNKITIVYYIMYIFIVQKGILILMIMMMMMMMMNCFCGIVDTQNGSTFISSPDHCQRFAPLWVWHATSRIWTRVELEFRLSWIKLSSSDNHYTTLSHYSVSFKQSFSTLSLRTKIRNAQPSFIVAPEDKCH